jgi:hypothetical protein
MTTGIVTDHPITVSTPEDVELIFKASGGGGDPVLDNIRLAAPEPASLGLMTLGLLGAGLFAGRKRRN